MAGADDHFRLGRDPLDVLDDVPATQSGHPQVDDCSVERLGFQSLEGSLTVLAQNDIVSHPWEFDFHHITNVLLVVDKQNSQFIDCSSSQRAVSLPLSPTSMSATRCISNEVSC